MLTTEPLQKAIGVAGGQTALARALGVRQGHVWAWLNRTGKVPANHCLRIEEVTKGKVTRYDLRPDVFGPAPKTSKKAA